MSLTPDSKESQPEHVPLTLGYEVMLETAKIQCVQSASGYSLLSGQEVFLGEVQNVALLHMGTLLPGRAGPTWGCLLESSELLLFAGPWSRSCSAGGSLANFCQVWPGKPRPRFCPIWGEGARQRGERGGGGSALCVSRTPVTCKWPVCGSFLFNNIQVTAS